MKKSVVIVSLILLLVLTGLGGWWFFAARQSPEAAGGLSKLFESAPPQASFIDVKDLIITLQGENGRERYLLLDLVLVVRGRNKLPGPWPLSLPSGVQRSGYSITSRMLHCAHVRSPNYMISCLKSTGKTRHDWVSPRCRLRM